MRLFRVTGPAGSVSQGVDQDGHGLYMETRAGIAQQQILTALLAAPQVPVPSLTMDAMNAVHEQFVRVRRRFRRFAP
jgi:hypothetical protein